METSIEPGANARRSAGDETTGLYRRARLSRMPLGEGWVDEAIAMLDDLECFELDAQVGTPAQAAAQAEAAAREDFEIDIEIVDEGDDFTAEVSAHEETVRTTAPVMRAPTSRPRSAGAPLSYVGTVRPFTPAQVCWRPRTRA